MKKHDASAFTFKFYDSSILLSQWQACRWCCSTDIPVCDSAWHTDSSRISSATSSDAGLILRVSLLLYESYSGYYVLIELYTQVEAH